MAVTFRVFLGLMVLVLVAGCGENEGEAAFREASEELAESQQVVAAARSRVDERVAVLEEAEKELLEAREALAAAQSELSEARAQVGRFATDDVLFREVQGRLLDDDVLADYAVAARVEKGVVTLTGAVDDSSQRERAGELAEAIPGVMSVDNRVTVSEPERAL